MRVYELRVDLTRSYKQYESDKVGVSILTEEGDDLVELLKVTKRFLLGEEVKGLKAGQQIISSDQLSLPLETPTPKETEGEVKPTPAKEKKVKEEPKKDELKVEEPKVEQPKVEQPKREEKPKVDKKPKAVKAIQYDRNNETHKKHVGVLLNDIDPNWRTTGMQKAVAASKALEGSDFMDSSGEIVASFKESLAELMK